MQDASRPDERHAGFRRVECDRCAAAVLVVKFSPQHTSVQWSAASVRTCAEAILDGVPRSYGARLSAHPTLRDYALTRELLRVLAGLHRGTSAASRVPGPLACSATARGFAWMFSGRRIPGGRLLGVALGVRRGGLPA